MKKIRGYFILILAAAVMSGCSGLNKMKKNADLVKYEVTPTVLEAHGGQVGVTVKGTFPEKYFDKKTTLQVTPVLTYAGGETAYDRVEVLQGEKVQANAKVISYSGGNFTYTSSIPYNEAMKVSELMLRITATRGSQSLDFDPVKLADGVIATSTLTEKHGRAVIMKDNFQRIIPETQLADIHYVINRSDIRSSELKGEDVTALKQYIGKVNEDPDRVFKSAVTSSYASPDGKFELNEKLSVNRGTAADRLIQAEFKKIEAAQSAGFFDAMTTPEDWEGFKVEVEKSNIPDKELILRVLSMYSDPAVREREIRNMSNAFEALKTDILPRLRRSKLMVNVDKIGRTDEQILSQMRSDPKVLDLEELLYSATLTSDLNEQLKFYQTAADLFPKCIRAHNNVGLTYLALGKPDDALVAFEKAKALQNNDVVKNNLGMAYLAKGELAKAEEQYASMTASTPESRWGLGVIAVSKGEYDQAVNYYGTESDYNLAHAQLLKGDVNRAKATLDAIQGTAKTSRVSYLKAVVGARLDDRNYMLTNLREAVAADPAWKAYARTDVEFAKFFSDDAFRAAVQ
ncbi:MAG: tetratricopeptide repeat protein [Bacteroidales bacterium]|nr:tetratricopeptide repeat protein [Bacteroidales bacterium]